MALEINTGNGPMVEATEKLWLTVDKDELVPDGDVRAAFLFCIPGQRVSKADAERLGMGKPAEQPAPAEEPEPEPEPEPVEAEEPEAKQQSGAAANKQRRRPADK